MWFRKNQAYFTWALMNIVDIVLKQDVFHNNLNSNNVMLHFPRDRDGAVFVTGYVHLCMGACSKELWQSNRIGSCGSKRQASVCSFRDASLIWRTWHGYIALQDGPQALPHLQVGIYFVQYLASKIYKNGTASSLF